MTLNRQGYSVRIESMKSAMIKGHSYLAVLLLVMTALLMSVSPVSAKLALESSDFKKERVLEYSVSKSLTTLEKTLSYRSRVSGNSNVPEGNVNSGGSIGGQAPDPRLSVVNTNTTANINGVDTNVNVSIPPTTISHILDGEIDGNRRTGGHSTNSGSVRIIGEPELDSNLVRRAPVEIDGSIKTNSRDGVSTLFPESWSDARIVDEFSQGLRAGSIDGPRGTFEVITPSGVTIQYRRNDSGEVSTFYPVFGS